MGKKRLFNRLGEAGYCRIQRQPFYRFNIAQNLMFVVTSAGHQPEVNNFWSTIKFVGNATQKLQNNYAVTNFLFNFASSDSEGAFSWLYLPPRQYPTIILASLDYRDQWKAAGHNHNAAGCNNRCWR